MTLETTTESQLRSRESVLGRLRSLPYFDTVTDEVLRELVRDCVVKRYRRGQFVFLEGDQTDFYFILIDGVIKFQQHTSYGKSITLAFMYAVETFGDMSLFDQAPVTASARAMTGIQVLLISWSAFMNFITRYPEVSHCIVKNLVGRMKIIQSRFLDLITCPAGQRVIKVLIPLTMQFGKILPLTHQDIADITGTTRETISSKLEVLQSEGIISSRRGKLVILDEEKLKKLELV